MRTMMVMVVVLALACGTSGSRSGGAERGTPGRSATAEEWKGQSVAQAEELMAGRFPGVTVTRVPGGIAVRIREGSTVLGSGEPLFVIDGQTIEAGPGGALVGIN